MLTAGRGALVDILAGPAVSPEGEPFPAGALVATVMVDAVVGAASVGISTLVNICVIIGHKNDWKELSVQVSIYCCIYLHRMFCLAPGDTPPGIRT